MFQHSYASVRSMKNPKLCMRLFINFIEQCLHGHIRLANELVYPFTDATGESGNILTGQLEMCFEGKGYFPVCGEIVADVACDFFGYSGMLICVGITS